MRAAEQVQRAPPRHLVYLWMIEPRNQHNPSVVEEARILQVSIFETIQRHLASVTH